MDTFEGAKTPHGKIIVGVYKLVHRDSGKFYIGSSGDFYNRRKTHIVALRAGQHHLQEMQNLYNESPHFTFELDSIGINYKDPAVREKAYDREQELLDQYWGDPLLLNQSRSARNIKLSEEREAARINKVHQAHQKPEVRAKVTAVNRTIRQSDKARKQQSVISKSLWQNDGQRARMEAVWKDPEFLRKQVENQPTSKSVIAAGQKFASVSQASQKLGISRNTVKQRIKDTACSDYYWIDQLPERGH